MLRWFKKQPDLEQEREDELVASLAQKIARYRGDDEGQSTFNGGGVTVQTLDIDTNHVKFKDAWNEMMSGRDKSNEKRTTDAFSERISNRR